MEVFSAHFAPPGVRMNNLIYDGKDLRVKVRADLCQTKRIFKGRIKVTLLHEDGSFEEEKVEKVEKRASKK